MTCLYASPPEQCWGSPGGLTEGQNRADGYWCPPDRRCRDVAESATYWPPGGTQWSSDTHLQTAGVLPWCLRQRSEKKKKKKWSRVLPTNRSVRLVDEKWKKPSLIMLPWWYMLVKQLYEAIKNRPPDTFYPCYCRRSAVDTSWSGNVWWPQAGYDTGPGK